MNIKTYPLQFTEEKLDEIRRAAKEQNKSIKKFMYEAIEEKMKKMA